MSYFIEIPNYRTYSGKEADFHFSYNANSGGGQSFLGGKFINVDGELTSPTVLDDYIGVFIIESHNENGQDLSFLLNDNKGIYKIKPRGKGSNSMKLEIGNQKTAPSKLISSFFMLPSTCTVKSSSKLEVSILTTNNYWLHSMWLECAHQDIAKKEVHLKPIDFIFAGGKGKDNKGTERYFKLDFVNRIEDILNLVNNIESLPIEIGKNLEIFAGIYKNETVFDYKKCEEATKNIMVFLAQKYPNEYSGIEDPLPFLMKLFNSTVNTSKGDDNKVIQTIYFGAPGTGKSFTVREKYEKDKDEKYIFRTTFHPDMDYSMFVGCYKPISRKNTLLDGNNYTEDQLLQVFMDSNKYQNGIKARYLYEGLINAADIKKLGLDGNSIADKLKDLGFPNCKYTSELDNMVKMHNWLKTEGHLKDSTIDYEFVPQTFTDAYVAAWKEPENSYYLIIEEINRGNCAQIFGDLFQLLDRDKKTGRSSYRIKADNDLRDYLKEQLPEGSYGIADDKLCLPPNLNIIATMNTSDQSLFPMDSAFKRRWEWEYVPIQYEKEFKLDGIKKENRSYYFNFCIGDQVYSWIKFIKLVNNKIFILTDAEDKKIGNYFVDLPVNKNIIDESTFINKVMFYLWNDVCKDEKGNTNNFYRTQEKEFSFNELFEEERQQLLIGFLENLGGDLTPIYKSNPPKNSAPNDDTSKDNIPESNSETDETTIQSDTTQGSVAPTDGSLEDNN